jgi:urease accessory protein
MTEKEEKLLNLIRISDTFFPIGSFTVSQGMEQLIADDSFTKEGLKEVVQCYIEKIWRTFDLPMFHIALEAARNEDWDSLILIDELCFASKIAEEGRDAMTKMGSNLLRVMEFEPRTPGAKYRRQVEEGKTPGMYPVALALAADELGIDDQGAVSLTYVNLIEITASLVRMAEIDYLEAQRIVAEGIKGLDFGVKSIKDISQSYVLVDIASMRHELNNSRMFIS